MVKETVTMFFFGLFVIFVCSVMLIGSNIHSDTKARMELDHLVTRAIACQNYYDKTGIEDTNICYK